MNPIDLHGFFSVSAIIRCEFDISNADFWISEEILYATKILENKDNHSWSIGCYHQFTSLHNEGKPGLSTYLLPGTLFSSADFIWILVWTQRRVGYVHKYYRSLSTFYTATLGGFARRFCTT